MTNDKHKNPLNFHETLWLLLLIGFTAYVFYLLLTNEILYFIHPRMTIYVLIMLITLTVLGVFQFAKVRRPLKNRNIRFSAIMFAIPLILGVTVAPRGLNESIAANRGLTIAGMEPQGFLAPPGQAAQGPATAPAETRGPISETAGTPLQQSRNDLQDVHFIETEHFDSMLRDLRINLDHYYGKKVAIEGFTYSDPKFHEGHFLMGRFLITCCAADATVIGLMSTLDESVIEDVSDSTLWARAVGYIETTMFQNPWEEEPRRIPLLRITELINMEDRPPIPYVYPADF